MTPEQDTFLRQHLWALLATTRDDGSPQVSMVAYQYDGGDLVVSCVASAKKFVNATKRPRVVLTVADDRSYLAVYGKAEAIRSGALRDDLTRRVRDALEPGDAAVLDRALASGLDDAGRVILRVTPDRVLGRI